ncbi:hydroxyisourate hydrolase [Bacillus suaedae]|uniref:hydroxyisourate hydrolase n=1 Tax=Halalkalibacter suaedae TaxID=2822140 RepID=UPI003211B79B
MGKLTTHVLDISTGKPGKGILVELWDYEEPTKPRKLVEARTNDDGRLNKPLLEGDSFKTGTYQLIFNVGEYYANKGMSQDEEVPFLDSIPIRFTIVSKEHYHVPLLIAPGGYSTYRGS